MKPATSPLERRDAARLLVIDPATSSARGRGAAADLGVTDLPGLLDAGDVVVVNDAATLPASLPIRVDGVDLELRLAARLENGWRAVLFGAGDWRDRTEDRLAPPVLPRGARIAVGARLRATVVEVSMRSPRLVHVEFDGTPEHVLSELYRVGRPVQYSHQSDALELWSVQTVYSGRPWAVEMPSAGRPLSWSLLLALRARGVAIASLTHAAGLSATGDPAIDDHLPLPERYDIPAATIETIERARAGGRRVVAMGTTVVRALEGSVRRHGRLVAGPDETDLILGADTPLRVVDSIVTGMHDPSESHFRLLRAFAPLDVLERGWQHAIDRDYRSHEFGDICLLGAGLARAHPEAPWAPLHPRAANQVPLAMDIERPPRGQVSGCWISAA